MAMGRHGATVVSRRCDISTVMEHHNPKKQILDTGQIGDDIPWAYGELSSWFIGDSALTITLYGRRNREKENSFLTLCYPTHGTPTLIPQSPLQASVPRGSHWG